MVRFFKGRDGQNMEERRKWSWRARLDSDISQASPPPLLFDGENELEAGALSRQSQLVISFWPHNLNLSRERR